MRKTYPARLSVAKLLNDLRQGDSYQETLRLDSELKASYKEAIHTLQSSKKNEISPTQFELSAMDFIMRRYLGALHFPFFGNRVMLSQERWPLKLLLGHGQLHVVPRMMIPNSRVSSSAARAFSEHQRG
ncbi:unnamed protein product [Fusarium graminearum]|nr:unnamed protein product [Fusarium graminearum]